MSYKTDHKIAGFFEYVVPPLEGFWWQENIHGVPKLGMIYKSFLEYYGDITK